MKTSVKIVLSVLIICATFPALSCQSFAAAAKMAGATGLINQNTADAISISSQAIGKAAEEITPEQEYYIGRAVAANILSRYKLWDRNPRLIAYVNQICNAIVINSPRPDIFNGYHVMLLDSDEINAFATSGGHIFITRGLVAVAKSEDALAGVIAHEIGHIQLQHSIKSIKTSRITQALLVTGTSAAGAATGYDVNELTDVFNESVGEIVTTMVNNGYSQTQEFDADNTALGLLAATGYNPSGLIDMLRELEKIQGSKSDGFNKTHPTPAQRITNAQKSVSKHRVANTAASRQARFAANAGI
jgi:predicted Zn-dependent protease